MPFLVPKTAKEEISLVLGNELRVLYWLCFRWFGVRVFVWFFNVDMGVLSSPFSGFWGFCFRVRFFLLSSSYFFFPLSSLGVGLGFSSPLLCSLPSGLPWSKAGPTQHLHMTCRSLFSLLSLPGRPPSLSLALFFLSLFFLYAYRV